MATDTSGVLNAWIFTRPVLGSMNSTWIIWMNLVSIYDYILVEEERFG
jgi:hypothetical protein